MDESDWLDDNEKQPEKKVNEQPKGGRGGRRGTEPQAEKREAREQPKREQKKEQKLQEVQNNGEMSIWLVDGLKEDEPNQEEEVKDARGKPFSQDMSYALNGEQLQPDKQINTSWMVQQKQQPVAASRGNRGNRDPPKQSEKQKDEPKEADDEQPASRRGNRESANFQKKAPYEDNRASNYYHRRQYGEREQGYRGRGRGRGRGNYQGGGYWGRQGQQQGNGRYRNSDYEGFKKRDNLQYKPKNFETDSESGPRGNRNDNYQNRQHNNNGNRRESNYNNYRSDNREGGYNKSYNNRDIDREYNDNRQYNSNRQQKEPFAFVKKQQYSQLKQPEPVKVVIAQKEEPLIPKGRRCWPESSIYILGCRFGVTYRPINQFRSKLMVIPYASLKMEYYPGNIINLSEVDYKARILAKGDVISSAGSVYLQKAISIGSFAGLAFLKIDEKRVDDSLKLGIKKLLGQVEQIEGADLNTIVFPICDQLGSAETVICCFLQNLQNCKKVKEVYVTTNQADCFMDSMKIFVETVQEMLDENKILIN